MFPSILFTELAVLHFLGWIVVALRKEKRIKGSKLQYEVIIPDGLYTVGGRIRLTSLSHYTPGGLEDDFPF